MTDNPHESGVADIQDALGQMLQVEVPTTREIAILGEVMQQWPRLVGHILTGYDDVKLQQLLDGYYDAGGESSTLHEALEDSEEPTEDDWRRHPYISGVLTITTKDGTPIVAIDWGITSPDNAPDEAEEVGRQLDDAVSAATHDFMLRITKQD